LTKKGSIRTKGKTRNTVLYLGLTLLILLGGLFGFRMLGAPLPFFFSQVKSAPEGVSVTISLLAFCRDNTTEIISTKEFKLSEIQLVSPSGKEVKYLAIAATFLSAPPKNEQLQQIQLSYQIAIKTNAGALTPLERTVTLPVVANLALHQTQLIPLTFSELGLSQTGDVAFLQADVKVSADMVTDQGRKLYSSTGHVESQLKAEEGGFARLGPWIGQSDQPAPARILASLHGSWTKPKWKSVAIVNLVDTATGLKSYMIAEPGSDSTQITDDTPTPGTPIDTVVIIPTGPTTTTTTTGTVTVPTYSEEEDPEKGLRDVSGETGIVGKEEELEVRASQGGYLSWIPNALGLGWLFRGDRLLMPWEMFGVTIDFTVILVTIATVMLIAVGLVLRRGKH